MEEGFPIFRNYLEEEDDKPYFTMNSLAYYYEDMERKQKLINDMSKLILGYDNKLNLNLVEMEKRVAAELGKWDNKVEELPETVNDLLTQWVEDGSLTALMDTTLLDKKADITLLDKKADVSQVNTLTAQLAETSKQVNGTVNLKQYEQFKSGTDWKPAILKALDYLVSIGGGTLTIPSGTYTTSPLDLRTYKNIKFLGSGMSKPWYQNTTLKFIGSGDVGLQFSDTTYPMTAYLSGATDCSVEDLFIECDNKVNVGINANYEISLKNVTVRRAIQDGIRLEDYTYPVYMDRVESSFNGRHGLYVRGHLTTKYFATRCEFSKNNGYGMLLEGGATSTFQDCLTQSNKQGGVKLSWKGDTLPDGVTYVENLLFINHYAEANGTLATTDPLYEGNYALVITSTNKTASANNKPRNIRFIQGALNASSSGKTYLIDSVYGLEFDGTFVDHAKGSIPTPAACHTMFVKTGATSADNSSNAPYPFITSYGKNTNKNVPFLYYKGGVMGSRGRTQLLTFYVTNIDAGQTINMAIPLTGIAGLESLPNGFPLMQDSTILATELYKKYGAGQVGRKGTLTAELCTNYISDGATPTAVSNLMPAIVMDTAVTNRVKTQYIPLQINLDTSFMIGFKLTASADYVSGSDTPVVLYVLLEN